MGGNGVDRVLGYGGVIKRASHSRPVGLTSAAALLGLFGGCCQGGIAARAGGGKSFGTLVGVAHLAEGFYGDAVVSGMAGIGGGAGGGASSGGATEPS